MTQSSGTFRVTVTEDQARNFHAPMENLKYDEHRVHVYLLTSILFSYNHKNEKKNPQSDRDSANNFYFSKI